MENKRYRIMGDGSGHKYFVRVGEEKLFEIWVESEGNHNILDFASNRIDGHFTFTDPRHG